VVYGAGEAHTAHPHATLISLFWPDFTPDSARQNLRQVIPPHYLLATFVG